MLGNLTSGRISKMAPTNQQQPNTQGGNLAAKSVTNLNMQAYDEVKIFEVKKTSSAGPIFQRAETDLHERHTFTYIT